MSSKVVPTIVLACVAALAGAGTDLEGQLAEPGDTLVLSLEAAQRLALEQNPQLLAASWRPAAVLGDVRTAGTVRFNPEAAFEARSPGSGIASRFEAELGVELELGGQRGLRGLASEASYASALRSFEDEGRRLLADVGRAYHTLVAAEQRMELVAEINALNAQLHQSVQTQLAEGEASVLETNLAAVEAARARARAFEASSARGSAALELGRLLGLERSSPLKSSGPGASDDEVGSQTLLEDRVRLALSGRPDLRALEHDLEWARQEERLGRRESLPNLRVSALATREDPLADPRFGVAVGIALPLFNRNQGRTERSRAEIAEVEQLRRASELRVAIEVEDALRVYASAQREVQALQSEMLGPIRESQGLLDIAYREGKIDLASLLLLRNQLLDAELGYWDAWERRERARTDLESATGEILQGVPFDHGSDR